MSGSTYSHNTITGGKVHMGNVYHQGHSHDQQIIQAILKSLWYEGMKSRREMIAEAQRGTFDWAFKAGGIESRVGGWEWKKIDANVRPWLEGKNEDMFCFVGKPGSGKSTFMKFLSSYKDIDEATQPWLEGRRLLHADHFFWIAGTGLQKQYGGLLRNLLYQCLSALSGSNHATDFDLVKDALQSRWSSLNNDSDWSCEALERVLSRLVFTCTDIKIFLVVDGLDECEPQDRLEELAQKMLWLSQLPNVKLCVSCRPWEILTRVFERFPTLHLDQLTYVDMERYVESRLVLAEGQAGAHSDFQNGSMRAKQFIRDIVCTAEGVFLWTELCMNSIISEVRKGKSIDRLQRSFRKFPPDLDSYFGSLIYERIPKTGPNVLDTTSALKLAMVIHSKFDIGVKATSPYNNKSIVNFVLLQNGNLDEGMSWIDMKPKVYSALEAKRVVEVTRRFLAEACRDLLVVVESKDSKLWPLCATVQFLHRSVFDFLNGDSVRADIENRSPGRFKTDAFLNELRKMRLIYLLGDVSTGCAAMDKILIAALEATDLDQGGEFNTRFLSTCDGLAAKRILCSCDCHGVYHVFPGQLIAACLQRGCSKYPAALLTIWPHVGVSWGASQGSFPHDCLLDWLLNSSNVSFDNDSHTKLLALLLRSGCDPNFRVDAEKANTTRMCSNSVWGRWLIRSKREVESSMYPPNRLDMMARTASLMIQHGADVSSPPCTFDQDHNGSCIRALVEEFYQALVPSQSLSGMQSLREHYSRDSVKRCVRRENNARAVRALVFSNQQRNASEEMSIARPKFTNQSAWDHERVRFLNGFLATAFGAHETCISCSKTHMWRDRCSLAWCLDCGGHVSLCHRCASKYPTGVPDCFFSCEDLDCETAQLVHGHTIVRVRFSGSWCLDGAQAHQILETLEAWVSREPTPGGHSTT